MSGMIEHVAKALRSCREVFPMGDNREYLSEDDALVLARAAIEAMREPTEAMLDGAALWRDRWDSLSVREQWQNLIDYALQASEGGGSP